MPGVMIFDPSDEATGLSFGDDQAAGLYLHLETDTLYMTDLQNIIEWEGDQANNMTYTWRSGRIRLPKPMNMGAALVEADGYTSLTFKLYAVLEQGLTLITTTTVFDDEPFRLPGGYQANLYEVELIGSERVTGVSVAQSIFDLAEG